MAHLLSRAQAQVTLPGLPRKEAEVLRRGAAGQVTAGQWQVGSGPRLALAPAASLSLCSHNISERTGRPWSSGNLVIIQGSTVATQSLRERE